MDFAVGLTRLHGAFSDLIPAEDPGPRQACPAPAGGKLSAKLQSIAIGPPATMIPIDNQVFGGEPCKPVLD